MEIASTLVSRQTISRVCVTSAGIGLHNGSNTWGNIRVVELAESFRHTAKLTKHTSLSSKIPLRDNKEKCAPSENQASLYSSSESLSREFSLMSWYW